MVFWVLRYDDCCVQLLVVSLADGKSIAQVGELAKGKLAVSNENVEKLCALGRQVLSRIRTGLINKSLKLLIAVGAESITNT